MPMAKRLITVGCLTLLLVAACSSKPDQQLLSHPEAEKRPEDFLAFRQQADADLVFSFFRWDEWQIEKPKLASNQGVETKSKATLLTALESVTTSRKFAVVIFDKRHGWGADTVSMDEIQSLLREQGFQRIVFQQAVGIRHPDTGYPILRDISFTNGH